MHLPTVDKLFHIYHKYMQVSCLFYANEAAVLVS